MPRITEIVMAQDGLGDTEDDWTIGVLAHETAPPRLLLDVAPRGRAGDGARHWVGLGDTFPVGGQPWRFEDIRFRGTPNDFLVTLRLVPPGAPPFNPPPLAGDRVWHRVAMHHPGPVDEASIAALEQELGQALPPLYRRWLAEHNGAAPAVPAAVPGLLVVLDQHQPLLGIRPDQPHHDLRAGRLAGQRFFSPDWLVVANAANGFFAVKVAGPGLPRDTVVGLDDRARIQGSGYELAGYGSRAEYIGAELVVPVAPDIASFEAYLQPVAF